MDPETAKCPNCGASIQVPLDRVTTDCTYCGSSVTVQEAVDRAAAEAAAAVDPGSAALAANEVVRARQCMAVRDYPGAFRYFSSALDRQASNEAAWQGCILASTCGLTRIAYDWVPFTGAMGLPSVVHHYLRSTPRSRRREAASFVERLTALLRADIDRYATMEVAAHRRIGVRRILMAVSGLCALLTLLVMALPFTAAFLVAVLVLAVRNGQQKAGLARVKAMTSRHSIEDLKAYLAQIEEVLAGETKTE
jgi:hypothetical protein